MKQIHSSILELIGHTPMVEASRFTQFHQVQGHLWVKLEYWGPTHSKKDRIARHMIEQAQRQGRLGPGQPVVEETSGNTGHALALVCALTGHPFTAAISAGNSPERTAAMQALGAKLLVVDQADGSHPGQVSGGDLEAVAQAARHYSRTRGAYFVGQFQNRENNQAHYLSTGREILAQTEGEVAFFTDFAGTGGTFAGVALALKEHNPAIGCYVAEPAAAPAYSDAPPPPGAAPGGRHQIQGGGYGRRCPLIDDALVDGGIPVTDEEAIACCRQLARLEGIFGGYSTGANAAAALKLLQGPARGKNVVILAGDTGLKYLSTPLYRTEGQ